MLLNNPDGCIEWSRSICRGERGVDLVLLEHCIYDMCLALLAFQPVTDTGEGRQLSLRRLLIQKTRRKGPAALILKMGNWNTKRS